MSILDSLKEEKEKVKRPHIKIEEVKLPLGTKSGEKLSAIGTLTKQFGIIDKRTRCEEIDKEDDKKLRVYTEMRGFSISPIDAIKKMAKASGDPSKKAEIDGKTVLIAMAKIIEELVGVIEKLPENVMSYDDKAKVMQYKDVRIHKPMSEKVKKDIKKKEEDVKKNEFLSALDEL